jgi:hypothetical protein
MNFNIGNGKLIKDSTDLLYLNRSDPEVLKFYEEIKVEFNNGLLVFSQLI